MSTNDLSPIYSLLAQADAAGDQETVDLCAVALRTDAYYSYPGASTAERDSARERCLDLARERGL